MPPDNALVRSQLRPNERLVDQSRESAGCECCRFALVFLARGFALRPFFDPPFLLDFVAISYPFRKWLFQSGSPTQRASSVQPQARLITA